MTNENETVADICREMKTYKNAEAFIECDDGSLDFVSVTDDLPKRIEAAHKHEVESICVEAAINMANKMIEFLEEVHKIAPYDNEFRSMREALCAIADASAGHDGLLGKIHRIAEDELKGGKR